MLGSVKEVNNLGKAFLIHVKNAKQLNGKFPAQAIVHTLLYGQNVANHMLKTGLKNKHTQMFIHGLNALPKRIKDKIKPYITDNPAIKIIQNNKRGGSIYGNLKAMGRVIEKDKRSFDRNMNNIRTGVNVANNVLLAGLGILAIKKIIDRFKKQPKKTAEMLNSN